MIYEDITEKILNCCFEVINTLGVGFLETVYKNALLIAMIDKDLKVTSDRGFEVAFRGRKIGIFVPDLIVEDLEGKNWSIKECTILPILPLAIVLILFLFKKNDLFRII